MNSSPNLLKKIKESINQFLESPIVISYTGPTKKVSGQSITISYNIFVNNPAEFLLTLRKKLDLILNEVYGEIICLEGSGHINDLSQSVFNIITSITWDIYLYKPEDFVYLRLLHEQDPLRNKEWISLDIDYVLKSAWFQE